MAKATYQPPDPNAGTVTLTMSLQEASELRRNLRRGLGPLDSSWSVYRALTNLPEVK